MPILPAVVLVAIKGFFDIPELMHFYRVSQLEFRVAIATFAGVVCLDVLEGVLVGVICSLLLLLRLAANPHTAVLGRIPGTRKFSDISRHPENETVPGIVIFRVDGGIFYFNAETVKQRILQLADSQEHPVQLLIFDLSSAYMVDIAGARMLKNLCLQLQTQGITLKLLRTRGSVRDTLRAEGLEESAGKMERGESISATVDEWREKLSVAMPTDVPADAPEESLPEEPAPTPASIQV
ncbi:MAG: STAS domain-containing protein [Coleofasciculaceae cyanobacterium SM2_3_26]|nr:STAS domain-containing protein [Coleofasciculaceae cyanobacterium SM2_3_26]